MNYRELKEMLKGNQHKLDKNKNGKLDADDFKKVRKEESELQESGGPSVYKTDTHEIEKYGDDSFALYKNGKKQKYYPSLAAAKAAIKEDTDLEEDVLDEKKTPEATGDLKDACWTGYTAVGMKMKNGKKVPNCVPESHAPVAPVIPRKYIKGTPEYKAYKATKKPINGHPTNNVKEGATGYKPGWMLKSDPALAAKVKEKQELAKKRQASYGDPSKGVSVKEEVEHIEELSKSTLGSYIKKAADSAAIKRKIGSDFEHMADKSKKPANKAAASSLADKYKAQSRDRRANIGKAVDRLTKEEVESVEEGMQQTLRKIVPGYAKKQIDKKMDDQKFGRTDVDKDANYYRYKKIQDKLKKEEVESIEERNKENAMKRKTMDASRGARYKVAGNPVPDREPEHSTAQAHNKAIGRALRKEDMQFTQEELQLIEQFLTIAEKMNLSKATMGDVIKDFKKSDAPQFAGKSDEKKRQMAIAAKLQADRESKNEEKTSFSAFLEGWDDMLKAAKDRQMKTGDSKKTQHGTVTKTATGVTHTRSYSDNENDDAEDKPKRGRGRPAGSKNR